MLAKIRNVAALTDTDQLIVHDHGHLWLRDDEAQAEWREDPKLRWGDLHHYKSLATGFTYMWYNSEIETQEEGAE